MSKTILGIDLGTTNSVVAATVDGETKALADAQGLAIVPSVVAFHPNGQVIVGEEAKKRRAIDPQNTVFSVKRMIGRGIRARETIEMIERMPFEIREGKNQQPVIKARAGEFAIPEISALVLNHMQSIAEASLGEAVTDAVVTVPASFNEAQRSATVAAGSIAGLNVLHIVNEPTAAAIAYGFRQRLNQTIAVYDFGGGTFDVSILRVKDDRFEVLGSAGDSFLGGDDIDEQIVGVMVQHFLREHRVDLRPDVAAMQRLRIVAEQVKIDLGLRTRSIIQIDALAYGTGGKPIHLEMEMTRDQLETIAGEIVRGTFPVCDEALHSAGLKASEVGALVLVGGSTRMPLIRDMAGQYFQQEPRADVNPDEAIAIGAALQAEALQEAQPSQTRTTSRGMGTPVADTRVDTPPDASTTIPDQSIAADESVTLEASQSVTSPQQLAQISMVKRRVTKPRFDAVTEKGGGASETETLFDDNETIDREALRQPLDMEESVTAKRTGPVVYDVTPQALGIATVRGFCEHLIGRNTAIPAETVKVFTTSRDKQSTVRLRVCQGNARKIAENTMLGDLVLEGLPAAPRGQTAIEVTFFLGAGGLLKVKARDSNTGREQEVSLELIGLQDSKEVAAASQRLREMHKK